MLISLSIKNFAIVRQLEVNWHSQMSTITGETGAGKSIAIDALAQTLGDRSDAGMVRAGEDKAEIIASFDITHLPQAQHWLTEHELLTDNECLLRRIISKEGRSRAYINGSQVPASQLKELGNLLVSIHGQHAHQLLTKSEHQRALLDDYANNKTLLTQVAGAYQQWQKNRKELLSLQEQQQEFSAQQQLLKYQVEELKSAELEDGEYEIIEQEHKRLHNAQSLLQDSQQSLDVLSENDSGNAYSALQTALSMLHKSAVVDSNLNSTIELLDSALIQLEEGASELRRYTEQLELNPERLFEIEQRLNLYMTLARKHQIAPTELFQHQQALTEQLAKLSHSDDRLHQLEHEIREQQQAFYELSEQLSDVRAEFANELNDKITASMEQLNMAGARFEMQLTKDENKPSGNGIDHIEFLVSANPGQPLQPLAKVASGGELSRISLAIQVIIAQRVTTPTLLFDEVDVGVSGPTASSVGKLMKLLSNNTQVICVTHLPQVASYGHQQHFVSKFTESGQTETEMQVLDDKGRIDELARLLGGDMISDTTRANAEELLTKAEVA